VIDCQKIPTKFMSATEHVKYVIYREVLQCTGRRLA